MSFYSCLFLLCLAGSHLDVDQSASVSTIVFLFVMVLPHVAGNVMVDELQLVENMINQGPVFMF